METSTSVRSGRFAVQDVTRLRAAALHASRLHPGPIGELLARELRAYADFGYRFGTDGLLDRLAAELLSAPDAPRPDNGPILALVRGQAS